MINIHGTQTQRKWHTILATEIASRVSGSFYLKYPQTRETRT